MISKVKNKHLLPVLALVFLGTFFFFVDGLFSFQPRLEGFVTYPFLPVEGTYFREDTDFFTAFIEKVNNPELFPRDELINRHFEMYPRPFVWAMAKLVDTFGLENAFVFASYLVNVLFWLGLYLLFCYISGNKWAAFLVAWASTIYFRRALGTAEWGLIRPQRLIPRTFTLSLSPWIIYWFLKWYRQFKVSLVFLALGLLANVHPLSALQLGFVLGLVLIWARPNRYRLQLYVFCIAAFVSGAFPVLLSLLARLASAGAVPEEILRFRVGYLFPPSLSGVIDFFQSWFLLPFHLAFGGFLVKILAKNLEGRRVLLLKICVATAVVSASAYIIHAVGSFYPFQPLRATRHFYTVFFCFASVLVAWLLALKPKRLRLSVLLVLPFLIFPRLDILTSFAGVPLKGLEMRAEGLGVGGGEEETATVPVGEIKPSAEALPREEKAVRRPQQKESEEEKEISKVVEATPIVRRTVVGPHDDWLAFYHLTDWFRGNTPQDALVVIPPDGLSLFRSYSQRSVLVSGKDGSPVSFSADYAKLWYERYQKVLDVYQRGGSAGFAALAKDYCLDFLLVFESGPFLVYDLGLGECGD